MAASVENTEFGLKLGGERDEMDSTSDSTGHVDSNQSHPACCNAVQQQHDAP